MTRSSKHLRSYGYGITPTSETLKLHTCPMLLLSRPFRRQFLRPKNLFLTVAFLFLMDALLITTSNPAPKRTSTLPAHLRNEKIFIVSIHRNSEYTLRLYWNGALLKLITALGPENVFVSILESGSQEDTKGALRDLQGKLKELGVENKIELDIDANAQAQELAKVPAEGEDRTGWMFTGRGRKGWELRRIPYLSRLRNRAMEPLLSREEDGKPRFDRVLWINDVVFTVSHVPESIVFDIDRSYGLQMLSHFSPREEVTMPPYVRSTTAKCQNTTTTPLPYEISMASKPPRSATHISTPPPLSALFTAFPPSLFRLAGMGLYP